MRVLALDRACLKEFETLPPKHFRQAVTKVFSLLREPTPPDARLLTGFPYFRVSVGEYRIVYDFTDSQVRVLAFGKRNDDEVYKQLKRLRTV